ncbi:hypothetical protein H8S23_08715 [Anaerofilum sp. BX8]|uniref:Uncharacterized protein n=2 Tax=Anaerofilum hominis TaxID=2763016 RepID=A0A923KW76_9FIRM|nr:hypothetical protein [Anaerofilum hominis]
MARRAGTDMELACDEMVLRGLDRAHRAAYGQTILAAAGKEAFRPGAATQFGGDKNIMKKRIVNLFDLSRKRKGPAVLAGFLCLLLLSGGLVACVPQKPGTGNASAAGPDSSQPSAAGGPSADPAARQTVGGTVTIDSVRILLYDNDPQAPYIKDIFTNNTDHTIVGWSSGMLAFDAAGDPLQPDWYAMDSSTERSYENVSNIPPYLASEYVIAPGKTHDVNGGWSIFNEVDADGTCAVAYALYCFKEITFEDGTVWINPDYDAWISNYAGKRVDVAVLESYYSSEQATVTL